MTEGGATMSPDNKHLDWPLATGADAQESVLGGDLVIEGDVTSDGPVNVQGRLVGSVRAPVVVVAGSGHVDGSVLAHDLSVDGAVSGTITARIVKFAKGAIVQADVIHQQITIEAGAEIQGRLHRRA
jgi:cytoskeletal protein CcmA (bactofilin family)